MSTCRFSSSPNKKENECQSVWEIKWIITIEGYKKRSKKFGCIEQEKSYKIQWFVSSHEHINIIVMYNSQKEKEQKKFASCRKLFIELKLARLECIKLRFKYCIWWLKIKLLV